MINGFLALHFVNNNQSLLLWSTQWQWIRFTSSFQQSTCSISLLHAHNDTVKYGIPSVTATRFVFHKDGQLTRAHIFFVN